jgi:gliding motility-associated-like protein
MKNNYISFDIGRFTWFKNGFGISGGLPSESRSVVTKTSWMLAFFILATFSFVQQVNATTCPNATAITPASLPITNQALICGTTNDVSSSSIAASAISGGLSTSYVGGFESLYTFVPTSTGLYSMSMTGQTWTQIAFFDGCPTTAGTVCVGAVSSSGSSKSINVNLTAGVTYYIMFDTFPTPNSPCPGTFSFFQLLPNTATAIATGGLWSDPATWGGTLPNAASTVIIPAGAIVTIDQAPSVVSVTVDGLLQWNASSNALTVTQDFTINATGSLLAYNTGGTGQTINIARNFINDGYANLALATLNFNGSGSTLSGAGDFQGGTYGIIRNLYFQNSGSNAITTTNSLIVSQQLNHTGGSLNTNGKLFIDNTAQVYGQSFNNRLASIAVTSMGSAYPVAPVVFGVAVTPYASGLAATSGTRYVSGSNVYLCTTAGTFNGTAPTSTDLQALFTTSGPTLLYIGTIGTLGTNLPYNNTLSTTTLYFHGNNVYQALASASITSAANMPVHTSGVVNNLRYIGTVAKVSPNFNATTGTVRSLNIVQRGSGFTTAPSVVFSRADASGLGSGAAATAVIFTSIAGPTNSLFQKSGGAATLSGGLTINNDQGASVLAPTNEQASSGVGNVYATNGGVNYSVAPQVGFSLPTALNLITNPGSGYTTAPTITVTGGNLVTGTALTSANFTITVNNGTIESVYLTGGTGLYSTLPTLAFSSGSATLAFPANCLPAATANIGANGQLVSFTMTNAGFGYVAAPTVGVGTTSGTAQGGTFTTVASGLTARVGLYNFTTGLYAPTTVAVPQGEDAAIPANRKLNALTLASNAKGMNITSNLTIFGSSTPLGFTSSDNGEGNVLDLGGNNLLFTWNSYAGRTGIFGTYKAYIKNGSMTLTGRGGNSTFNYPFSGTFTWYAGSTPTAVTTGSSVTRVTVSDTAAPTSANPGTGIAIGSRAFRVQYADIATGVTPVTGLNPTVALNYNSQDALTGTQDQLFVSESSALNGPWAIRSVTSGTGALAATGSRTTATTTPGPIVPTNNKFYAWSNSAPQIASVTPLTLCANSGTFTITGVNFSGVTAVSIGGTPVTAFTVVSDTSITGYAGNGTTGTVSLIKNGATFTGTDVITVSASPAAPNVSPATATVNLGATVSFTATGSGSTFNWYTTPTGGTSIYTGATYSAPVCATTTLYVASNNGSCDGARTAVQINVNPTAITASVPYFCGTGGATVLTVTPNDPSITYTWDSVGGSPSFSATTGQSVTINVTDTSDIRVTATNGACTTTTYLSIGVYDLPSATVTTTASGVCPGTSATIGSGLSAGNFTVSSIPYAATDAPSNAGVIMNNGTAVLPLTGGSMDDGGWSNIPIGFNFNYFGNSFSSISAGTNGLLMFGTPSGYGTGTGQLGQFSFSGPPYFPNTNNPGNIIALMAADLHMGTNTTNASIKYWTEGYAPNRTFVIEYRNVNGYSANPKATVQCRLKETIGTVEIHIFEKSFTNSAIVGLQDATKTIGAVAPGRAGGTWSVTTPEAWRFIPPANYNTTWTATDANGTTTIASGTNIFSQSVSPAITTTYSISYTNQTTGCTNAAGSAQVLMTVLNSFPPANVSTIATSNSICFGESVGLSLSYTGITDGLVFQWQSSIDNGTTWQDIASATTTALTVTPTVATKYRCRMISCGGTPGYSSVSTVVFANNITGTSPATRCGTGTATINALSTAGSVVNWYAAATGGPAIGTGVIFTTPTIATTTTYYAAAVSTATGSLGLGTGGTTSSSSASSFLPGFWGGAKTQYIIKASELIQAGLSPGAITSLGFEPTDSGQTYQGFNVRMGHTTADVAGANFIANTGLSLVYTGSQADQGFTPVANTVNNLAFGTGTGTASSFVWDGASNIVVSISWSRVPAAATSTPTTMKVDNVGFVSTNYTLDDNATPAEMADVMTTFGTSSNRPRFIFNGQIACASPRVPVTVTVTPAPAITLSSASASICNGGSTAAVTIATGASDYNTYVWSPATGVTGNSTTGWIFNPTATTTYTLTASQSAGSQCANTTSFTVNVNDLPSAITITPANPSACVGVVLPMTASGGNFAQNAFAQPMEVLPTNFDATVNSTATLNTTYFAQGAASVLFNAGTSANETYELNQNVDLSSAASAVVTFKHIAATEAGWDYGYVEYSNDGGTTWTTFTPANYTGTASATVFNANVRFTNASYADWDTTFTSSTSTPGAGPATSLWKSETFTIPTTALTNQFRVRFRYTTDTSVNYFGWLLDDVKIVKTQGNITWSPVSNLYTDAAATVPYTAGTSASTIYVLPTTVAPLTYVATSTNGSSGCITTASITVRDAVAPVVVTRPVTVQLNAAGTATVTAAQVNNGSTDNCSIATITVSPTSFTCANVGPNTVTLTATDASGNTSTGTAVVTVQDLVAPTVVTQPVTVLLNANGQASITAAQINNGSTDNCGVNSVTVSPSTFTCANLGPNTVTLTVTDVNGNTATGTAIVTVSVDFSITGDNDLDGTPDNCDPDDDNDGILDTNDNCPLQANTNQADNDNDDLGDACDNDDDNDGVLDGYDNCPMIYNPGQEDIDNDGIGDICDTVEINVSEAITPDGDGVNDVWFINNIENHPNNIVKVYNRWGDLIFSKKGYQNDWNGSFVNNGSNIPDASSYYYQIDLDGNGSIDHDGWIYITK